MVYLDMSQGELIIGVLTIASGIWTAWIRRKDRQEQRKWDLEDRAFLETRTNHLGVKIEENTEISKGAFDVANHVNEKIVAIGNVRLQNAANALNKNRRVGD